MFGKKMFNFKVAVFIFKKSIARASERCGKLRLNRNMYKERKKKKKKRDRIRRRERKHLLL